MPDFLTNVETAFLSLFTAHPILGGYNWQQWDSDVQVELPRGVLGLRSRVNPDETPYRRIDVSVRFEGRPKKPKLGYVMAALTELLEQTNDSDLSAASGNTVVFIGKAINIEQDRPITSGLRTWTQTFTIYAVPMN
jgi:hypothetical protein